ncbi:AI-2E family transporter [Salegentibacter sp. HM20]
MTQKKLLYSFVALVIGAYFLFNGLVEAKEFLAPIVTAIILALLMIPLSNKMEAKGMKRMLASFINTIILFILSLVMFAVLSLQVKTFIDDWDKITETVQPKIEQLESYIFEHTPLTKQEMEQYKEERQLQDLTGENSGAKAFGFLQKSFSFMGDYILTFIYIFFLLQYRHMFKKFILKLFSEEKQDEVKDIIEETAGVAQGYLKGKLLLIIFLSVTYIIGLGISGVNNFIIISLIAAFLSLIPFIGNMVGLALAFSFGYLMQGDTSVLIGIIITFTIVQFLESYVLEPYIVGDQVDLHPFFVILAIILGNMVWGVMGMILAIPVLGILNVIFCRVKALNAFGYLIGNDN